MNAVRFDSDKSVNLSEAAVLKASKTAESHGEYKRPKPWINKGRQGEADLKCGNAAGRRGTARQVTAVVMSTSRWTSALAAAATSDAGARQC